VSINVINYTELLGISRIADYTISLNIYINSGVRIVLHEVDKILIAIKQMYFYGCLLMFFSQLLTQSTLWSENALDVIQYLIDAKV